MNKPPDKKGSAQGLGRGLTNYGDAGFSLYLRRAFARSMGYSREMLDKPIVGICQSASGFNSCHRDMPALVEAVKRGVLAAGALPIDFPTISLGETYLSPTSLKYRNLMSMDVEEMVRAQPMDAVVLIGGCDKTVPALLMGAASAGVPAIVEVTGPMLVGHHRETRVGACTDCRRYWAAYRAGQVDGDEITEVNDELVPSYGSCGVMGTASTMAIIAEALGMMLPGGACIPAVMADRMRHAEATGHAAVALAARGTTPDQIMTADAFENAMRLLHAVGGSTNGIVHLTAIAGRLGIKLDLQRFDEIGRDTPVLVDLKPTGENYMQDLNDAGGLAPVFRELRGSLRLDAPSVNGRTLGENIDTLPPAYPQSIVRSSDDPIGAAGTMTVLHGSLAPDSAIIKHAAASAGLLQHRGRAVVFEDMEDLAARIDDPELDVEPDDILVLKNAGPIGAPGMPESGYLPIPKKLGARGVKDMVRISDARMSGTAFGTIVLHICPESALGGPLALVRNGDLIELDVKGRRIDLLVDEQELARRRAGWQPPQRPAIAERGYWKLHFDEVQQANLGADLQRLRHPSTDGTD
ncbi:MAG: dihydroxy-acid dehydratase [Gammaproteobacteria bacterium]|nr:dihydroxy-acid dehydratase [Gammaproteobacteria bacterium]